MRNTRIFILVACLLTVALPAYGFGDIPEGYWAQEQIAHMQSRDQVAGYPDGTYRPGKTLTRAEAAVMLVNAVGLAGEVREIQGAGSIFRDVTAGHWATAYINVAWEKGFVSGYPDGTFRPQQQVNRVEMTSMLVRALDLEGQRSPTGPSFSDAASIPAWGSTSVAVGSSLGLLKGYPDGSFRPLQNVRRDEATSMLAAFVEERGIGYHFHGTYLGNTPEEKIRLKVNGIEFDLGRVSGLKVSMDGSLWEEQVLSEGMEVLVILNDEGQLAFLKVIGDMKLPLFVPTYSAAENLQYPLQMETMVMTQRSSPSTAVQASQSASILRQSLGLQEQQRGVGEVIAVIDTGVDPRISSLRHMSDGSEKLLDFVTLGEEGRIETRGLINKIGLYANVGERRYNLSGVITQSGQLPFGWIDEAELDVDLNGNGNRSDRLMVLLADSRQTGVYDRIHIDLKDNGRFSDLPAGRVFVQSQESYQFPGGGRPLHYVVSEIDSQGRFASLGFDLNGHGTMMAAAAAGSGSYQGVAPDSRLLIIKAFNREGEARWTDLEEAIRIAVQRGATVVNLSMGYLDQVTSGINSLTYLAEIYNERYGVVFVGAAGNYGPGTLSLATPGNGRNVVTVGAYLPGNYIRQVLQYPLNRDILWPYSSSGPREDGYGGVDILAPGMAVLPTPQWDEAAYRQMEGTSVSAALVSGGIAAVLSGMETTARNRLETKMPRALGETAGAVNGPDIYSNGSGKVQFSGLEGWRRPPSPFVLHNWHRTLPQGQGIFARAYLPGNLSIFLDSTVENEELVYWNSDVDWMRPQGDLMVVPGQSKRSLQLDFRLPETPGLHLGTLRAVVMPQMEAFEKITVGVAVPEDWVDDAMVLQGNQRSGAISRHFLTVDPGTERIQGILQQKHGLSSYLLFDPQGKKMAGFEMSGTDWQVDYPVSGTWELVVYSPLENVRWTDSSTYEMSLKKTRGPSEFPEPRRKYFIGNITRPLASGRQWIGMAVRDEQFHPVDGVMLEMGGKLFQVRDGWLNMKVDVTDTQNGYEISF